jgi:hypothetical protein
MGDPSCTVGNGVLLWFEVDDFDAAVARARGLEAPILLDVHRNPNANHRELWIRDRMVIPSSWLHPTVTSRRRSGPSRSTAASGASGSRASAQLGSATRKAEHVVSSEPGFSHVRCAN